MNSNFPNTFYLIQKKKEPDLSTLNLNGEQDLDRIITLTYIKLLRILQITESDYIIKELYPLRNTE